MIFMKCFNCHNEILKEPEIKTIKVNGGNEIMQRAFCNKYCVMKWENSEVV